MLMAVMHQDFCRLMMEMMVRMVMAAVVCNFYIIYAVMRSIVLPCMDECMQCGLVLMRR